METSNSKGLVRWFMASAILVLCVGGQVMGAASDDDAEWESDLDFLVRLGQERFDLYAEMQRTAMTARYSARKDDLRLANAVYFFSVRKPAEAERYLRDFRRGHKLYTRALYVRGTKYAEIGMFPQSAENFSLYFKAIPEAPKRKRGKKEFVTALQYYSKVLQELGRGEEAAALIDKMPQDDNLGERELAYLKQLSRIEAEEGKLDSGKAVNAAVLNAAIRELRKLFFVRDGISALAAIQVGRIQGILGNDAIRRAGGNKGSIAGIGNFLDGIKTIKQFEDFIVEMERGNSKSTSPMPEALYYKAINIMGFAEVTAARGKVSLAAKQLSRGAVVYFKMIQRDYRKSPFVHKLPKQYLRCEEINGKWQLNAKLNLPKAGKGDLAALFMPGDLLVREAENYRSNRAEALKRYSNAIERYKKAVDRSKGNPAVCNHVGNYMRCLAMADRLDEGRALLEDLLKRFPDEKSGIGKAALMLGAFANKRMNEWPKGKVNPLKAKQEATYFWARNMFVDNDPSHPQAPLVAYDLAVTKFNEAMQELKKAQSITTGQRKAAEDKALKLVREAIPFYQRVAEVFPMHPKGKAALMKAGQLFNILNRRDAAIEYFSRYLASDDGTLPKESLLEAQYFIAELQYRSNRPKEARESYLKVKAVTESGQPYAALANTAKFREIAMAYIPDAMDRESDLLTNQLGALEERKNALASAMYDLDLQIRGMRKAMAGLPEQEKKIRERTDELKRLLNAYELDYKGAARQQAKAEAAKPNAAKTEQEYYDIFVKGVEEAAQTLVRTEQEAIAAQRKAMEDRRASLSLERQDTGKSMEAIEKVNGKLRTSIDAQRRKIKEIKASFAEIDRKVEASEARCGAYRKTLASSKDDTEIKRTKQSLAAEERVLAGLKNDRLDIVSHANKQAIVSSERDVLMKRGAISDNTWQLESLKSGLELLSVRDASLVAQQSALDARRSFAEEVRGLLGGAEAARLKANASVKARGAEVSATVETSARQELEALSRLGKLMGAQVAKIEARKAALQAEVKKIEHDLKPMEASWKSQKEEAVRGYREYLASYPQGKYYASCTTDLAGGLVDLERYGEAVQQLNNLISGRVPECSDIPGNEACDPNKTVHALYNLAKAQTKAQRYAEASGTYERLMNNGHAEVRKAVLRMPLGNLFFIADQGMTVGASQAALSACEAILARVGAPGVSLGLRPSQVERVYVKAAEAALRGKDPAKALSMAKALLERNSKTAYLYDIRELEAEALVSQGKVDEGIGMLNQIIRRSGNVALANRMRCAVARLYLLSGKPEFRKSAENVYESIVRYSKDSVELDSEWASAHEAKENQPWIDRAFVELAKLYRAGGDSVRLSSLKSLYGTLFPTGAKASELSQIN